MQQLKIFTFRAQKRDDADPVVVATLEHAADGGPLERDHFRFDLDLAADASNTIAAALANADDESPEWPDRSVLASGVVHEVDAVGVHAKTDGTAEIVLRTTTGLVARYTAPHATLERASRLLFAAASKGGQEKLIADQNRFTSAGL